MMLNITGSSLMQNNLFEEVGEVDRTVMARSPHEVILAVQPISIMTLDRLNYKSRTYNDMTML
jgi:hypothetical protein